MGLLKKKNKKGKRKNKLQKEGGFPERQKLLMKNEFGIFGI
jgi:hypothetical protein